MKLLLVNDNLTPNGGAERYFWRLKQELQTIPYLNIYTLGFGPQAKIGENSYVFKRLDSKIAQLFWRCVVNPILYVRLRRLIKKINPDVIHLHNIKQYPLTLLKALKGFKVVQTIHDYSVLCPTGQNIHKNLHPCPTGIKKNCWSKHNTKYPAFVYFILLYSFYKIRKYQKQYIHIFLAPSPILQKDLEKNFYKKCYYIPPFIDIPPLSDTSPSTQHFLFAGNLGKHKGTPILLREFAQALQGCAQLQLTIIGEGPEKISLEREAKQLGIENHVHFLGWQKDLSRYYQRHLAVIFPSIGMESFGLVITEALSWGRPVIAINRGTAAWLVEDKDLLFDPHKMGDLAQRILQVADDPKKSLNTAHKARAQLAMRFDNQKSLQAILNIYSLKAGTTG